MTSKVLLKIMLVAAEASGDVLGANLGRELKARLGDVVELVGVGGPRMRELGVESPFDISELSILGVVEGIKAYKRVKQRVDDTVKMVLREQPDTVILIDSWGFTIRVAKAVRKVSPKTILIKYVGPQVWASRPGRAKVLAQSVDHLLALYPMDAPWFEKEGLSTTVVGSSALHLDMSDADPQAFRTRRGIAQDAPLMLVLPGSRPKEIERMTPVYEQVVENLKARIPELQVAVVAAGTVADDVHRHVAGWPFRAHLVGEDEKYAAMKAANVALATSGTVSSEIAMAGTPMVIAYKIDNLSYRLMKPLVTAKYFTMLNLAADDEVAKECIQFEATPEFITPYVERLLMDKGAAMAQADRQTQVLEVMGRGGPNPSVLAADAVLSVLEKRRA